MVFPPLEEYSKYHEFIFGRKIGEWVYMGYKRAMKKFNTPECLVEEFIKGKAPMRFCNIVVFLCFMFNMKLTERLNEFYVYKGHRIALYFGVNERFLDICNEEIKDEKNASSYFFNILIKALIFLGKKDIDTITFEDIKLLFDERFVSQAVYAKRFIDKFEKIIGVYMGKATPKLISQAVKKKNSQSLYGTDCKDIIILLEKYLNDEYYYKGYNEKNPCSKIKSFFVWLHSQYTEVTSIKQIQKAHWEQYREYVNNSDYKLGTKFEKLSYCIRFFTWLKQNEYIDSEIIDIFERVRITTSQIEADTKPKMFESREHAKIILNKALGFAPKNEKEFLLKHLIIIASATGLRLGEIIWLGPGCIINIKDGIGELKLQVNEKLNIRNKPVSVLPWGIESIQILEERFKNRPYIEFFNKKTNGYFPILFEDNRKVFSKATANLRFKKFIEDLDLVDENGNRVFYNGVAYHGMRHQKFNDIFEVTNGSLVAVKMDSHHHTIAMAKRYTKQSERKRQREAYKLLEEGKIIGKGADILKSLLNSPYTPERYLEVVKKMSFSEKVTITGIKKAMKYLGFGYCAIANCKLGPICEGCDYFWTCKAFEEELKERYAQNFLLAKSSIHDILKDKNQSTLLTGLKYQEKWLIEVGATQEEINELRYKYIER